MSLINRFNEIEEDNFSSPNFIQELCSFLKHFLSMDKEDDSSIGLIKYKGTITHTTEEITMTKTQQNPTQCFINHKDFNPVNIPMFSNSQNKTL